MRAVERLRLPDRRSIYVEPMALAFAGRSVLVAGEPAYLWRPVSGARPELEFPLSFTGVLLNWGTAVTLAPPDLPGSLTNVRALGDPSGGFTLAFVQYPERDSPDRPQPPVLGYWVGRTAEGTWRDLERLPLPASDTLLTARASDLVRLGDTLALAVPLGSGVRRDVAVYTRVQGRWSLEILRTGGASYVALTAARGQLELLVVRGDSTRLPDGNSLFRLSRIAGEWRDRGLLVHGGREPVHRLKVTGGGITPLRASWVSPDGSTGEMVARALQVPNDGPPAPVVTLARGIDDLTPVRGAQGAAWWVVQRPSPEHERGILQLVGLASTDSIMILDAVANPFTGMLLAYGDGSGVTVVGPVLTASGNEEPLVSGLLRLQPRCGSRGA